MPIDLTPKHITIIPSRDKIEIPLNFRDDIEWGADKPAESATNSHTFYQNDAPTGGYKPGDIWVDTNDNNHAYRVNDSMTWVSIRDAAYSGRITSFFQAGIPTSLAIGDLWFDTDDKNKCYRAEAIGADEITAGEWVIARDTDVPQAIADAATAQSTADGKIVTFYQSGIPTATDAGDLWVDTDDGKIYRATAIGDDQIIAGEWERVDTGQYPGLIDVLNTTNAPTVAGATDDTAADAAQSTANIRITTFIQTAAPTALATGDLWIDSDDNNKLYRWSSSAWVSVIDGTIAVAQTAADTAQAEADRKVVTFIQTTAPTAEQTGDIWFDSDDENEVYRWSGSAWVSAENLKANWSKIVDDDTNKPDNNADVTSANTAANIASQGDLATQNTADFATDVDGAEKPANNATLGATFGTDIAGGGSANDQVSNAGYGTRYLRQLFGDGSDGNVTISSPTTLTRDMYYDSLTVNDDLNCGGYRIFVKGTLTIASGKSINRDGNNGVNGGDTTGGEGGGGLADTNLGGSTAGGFGGTPAKDGGDIDPGSGGDGGDGGTGDDADEGVGGNVVNPDIDFHAIPFAYMMTDFPAVTLVKGGAGGGGGSRDTAGSEARGGGGGGGGGIVVIAAKTIVLTGNISTDGGGGGDGSTAGGSVNTGGGGGGGGGVTVVIYNSKSGAGAITAAAGAGGSGNGTGSNGDNGVAGAVIELEV